jgi:hypothetical protein
MPVFRAKAKSWPSCSPAENQLRPVDGAMAGEIRRRANRKALPAPTGEPEIWKIAALLVDKFRNGAPAYAERRGEQARRLGDDATTRIWARISAAVEELLKPAPDDDDTVH